MVSEMSLTRRKSEIIFVENIGILLDPIPPKLSGSELLALLFAIL
jgi:hypothetical protein